MGTCTAKSVALTIAEMAAGVQNSPGRGGLAWDIAFVDPRIDDLPILLARLRLAVEAMVLDHATEQPAYRAIALQTRLGFEAIHTPIYNRPSEATFSAGALSLWGADGDEYAADLAEIGEVPGEENLNLRMWETPNGERFLAFVDAVAGMACTNVAVSKRQIGTGALEAQSRDSRRRRGTRGR